MRRLAAFAVAAGLAWASLASAGTKYVSPTGTFSWLAASNPATPTSIDTANVRASSGDLVLMAAGTYTGKTINPQSSGSSSNRITFCGPANDSTSVVVAGITLGPGAGSYTTVKWMKCTGSFTADGLNSSVYPIGDSLYFVRVRGGFSADAALNLTVSNCLLGVGNTLGSGGFDVSDVGGRPTRGLTVTDVVAHYGGASTGAPGNYAYHTLLMESANFTRFKMYAYMSGSASGAVPMGWYGCPWNTFTDCKWTLKNTSTLADMHLLFLRDGCNFNTFTRDSFVVDPASTNTSRIDLSATGTFDNEYKQYSNTWTDCYLQSTSIMRVQAYMRKNTFTGCIFNTASRFTMQRTGVNVPSVDSTQYNHCTFYSSSDRVFALDGVAWSNATVKNCLFVLTGASTSEVCAMTTVSGSPKNYDYNLFWTGNPADSSETVYTGSSLTRVGPSVSWCTVSGQDCHSRFGNPSLTSPSTGDFTPSLTGNAYGTWWPDGYVGAIDPTPDSGDKTPPATITDLAVDGTTTSSISLTWTEVGDDGATGAATSYQVRYSTSAITSGNWASATVFASPPPPVWNSQPISVEVTGLSAGTTYYFAVKAVDDEGNESDLSNVVSDATTAAPDVTAPATISSLATSLPTTSTVTLTWTAPGDDGSTGTATSYQGRYATSAITNNTEWNAATAIGSMPTPAIAGTSQSVTVTGLSASTTYYFNVRATDDASNQGAVSNSPSATTTSAADVTAPAAITTLSAVTPTTTTVSLSWTAPGDDGSTGTATSYVVKYATAGPITNEVSWAAATTFGSPPTPQVAGSTENVTVTGLVAGTTYYFNVRAVDEASNQGGLSNSTSRATLPAPDVTRPATISVTAKQWSGYADGALLVFSAVGDDSLTGTATSYQVRYRTDAGITSSTWDALSLVSLTYAVANTQTPRASGSADTVYVRGLRPGATYWFAVRAVDEASNISAVGTPDSVVMLESAASWTGYPLVGLYAGAGSGSRPAWRPLVSDDGSAVDTTSCRYVSRFSVVSLNPTFADSLNGTGGPYGRYMALAAIKTLRAMNPNIKVVAEPAGSAAWIRGGPVEHPNATDSTARTFDYYFQQWRAARIAGGGWTTGSGAIGGGFVPGGYTDSTGSRGFLWCNRAGYKGWFYQTYNYGVTVGASTAGVAGFTNWNVNFAYQPSAGRFPVVDSVVAVVTRNFITRRHPDGSYVWDGVQFDLFTSSATFSNLGPEDIDYTRAGYATKAAFDTAWVASHQYAMKKLRQACVDAGRPDFLIGGNGASGIAADHINGWMRENWPALQGGDAVTNFRYYIKGADNSEGSGGQTHDQARFAWAQPMSWLFRFACNGDSCGTALAPFDPDSVGNRQSSRYALGAATLTGHILAFGPDYASVAKGGGYERWWYDEYAIDTVSAQATRDVAKTGWMGQPTTYLYNTVPAMGTGTGVNGDLLYGSGSFESSGIGNWTRTSNSQVSIAAVTDTIHGGSTAMRARISSPQANDYSALALSTFRAPIAAGDTFTVTFWARSSIVRPIQVGMYESPGIRSSWSTNQRVWVYPGAWQPYRLIGTIVSTAGTPPDSAGLAFWFGDTTGTVWIDDVTVHRRSGSTGIRPLGGSYVREFRRGFVAVNPYLKADTLTIWRATRRILTQSGKNPDVNSGQMLAAGDRVVLPAQDARFFLFPVDSLRPSRVTDLVATSGFEDRAAIAWSAPGNDSATGTAVSYQFKIATSAITSEADWTAATTISGFPAPAVAGTSQNFTLLGLSPSTTYYFAMRAYDNAGFVGAISNSDSTRTLAPGAAPSAAFTLDHYSGAEPLVIFADDASSSTPTAWEWFVEREDHLDPSLASTDTATFVLSSAGKYYVNLQVSNAYGADTTQAQVDVTCTPPSSISSLVANAISTTQVLLTWTEPGDDGDVGAATAFDVRYKKGSTLSEALWAGATQVTSGIPLPSYSGQPTGMTVNGLAAGETYTFGIKARDENDCYGDLSNVVTLSMPGSIEKVLGITFGSVEVKITVERKP